MTSPRLGFIGLGQIGAPMASRWIDWPGGLTVFDVVDTATQPFASQGATVAASPAALAEEATVISLMVRDDEQVRQVVAGDDGILRTASPGTVVVIHSTVEADTPAEIADLCRPHRVHVLDVPVSGGMMGAHDGTLALMVGGSDEAVALASPALERLGTLVAHMGPLGAGTRAKLARNLITFASYVAVAEAARLAEAADVDLTKLGEVVRHSDAVTGGPGAIMVRDTAAALAADDGLRPIFEHTRGLGEKDLQLAMELGDALGVDTPVARQAKDQLGRALGLSPQEIAP